MKVLYHIWLLVLTVFFSTLASSLILELLGRGGFLLYFAVIMFMTIVFGIPCSLLIRLAIRRKDGWGQLLRGLLHAVAGYSIPLFMQGKAITGWHYVMWIELFRSGMPIMFAAHALIYYVVYAMMRHSLQMDRPMWEESADMAVG